MSTTTTNEVAVISTAYGDMTLSFWPDVAPKTVENFKKLAREGFYDGTAFHRIIKGFMVQGGCPNTKPGARGMPGTGDPGYKVKAEFNAKSHVRGVISMARSASPDSAGCQFFICHGDAKFLDRQYTAFGQLTAGDDVLETLANIPTKSGGGGEKSTPHRPRRGHQHQDRRRLDSRPSTAPVRRIYISDTPAFCALPVRRPKPNCPKRLFILFPAARQHGATSSTSQRPRHREVRDRPAPRIHAFR